MNPQLSPAISINAFRKKTSDIAQWAINYRSEAMLSAVLFMMQMSILRVCVQYIGAVIGVFVSAPLIVAMAPGYKGLQGFHNWWTGSNKTVWDQTFFKGCVTELRTYLAILNPEQEEIDLNVALIKGEAQYWAQGVQDDPTFWRGDRACVQTILAIQGSLAKAQSAGENLQKHLSNACDTIQQMIDEIEQRHLSSWSWPWEAQSAWKQLEHTWNTSVSTSLDVLDDVSVWKDLIDRRDQSFELVKQWTADQTQWIEQGELLCLSQGTDAKANLCDIGRSSSLSPKTVMLLKLQP